MQKGRNQPFIGDTKKVKGNIMSKFPNRRQRRAHLNELPNSTKVGRRGKGVSAPIRSRKQFKYKASDNLQHARKTGMI
jgi:hypothetical protein